MAYLRTLRGWRDKIKRLPDRLQDSFGDVESELLSELQTTYRSEQSPYKTRWKKRKQRKPWPTLFKSGRQFRSFDSSFTSERISFSNSSPYSKYHQSGTRNMAQRLILPTSKRGLPKSWRRIISKHIRRSFKRHLR